ncbi:hypothetical protein B0H15DRAFT_808021 [Mycena belliarum]|uniref:Uncharacterized protein n=1 Tax=Mycena belliarum TaxID=1033014 RepID=A0AAD6UIC3_9AGAR|nr:hypothetical protein B0H15DRAFT_808021 [Mycena belliae]
MDEEVPDSDAEEYLPMQPLVQAVPFTPASVALTDAISPFSVAKAVASTQDPISSSSNVRPPRPRPKPTYKGAPGHPSNLADTSVIESFSDTVPSSLSDRVKTRRRGGKALALSPSSSGRPAVTSDVIEIESSDDELNANLDFKAASIKKQVPEAVITTSSSISRPSSHQHTPYLPTTVPFPSPLPPSDPFPQSTGTSRYVLAHDLDREGAIPPIATLSAAGDTSFEVDSSPGRRKATTRPRPKPKPKKPKPPAPLQHDELRYDFGAVGSDTRVMPPPLVPRTSPTATAAPPVAGPSTGLAPGPLPDLVDSMVAPPSKPAKKRKKQTGDEGEKEKPAKKPRAKKVKKDVEGEEGGGGKPKKNGKGKEKEKEEFKSAEFITEEDDDDPLPRGGVLAPALPSLMDGVLGGFSGDKPISVISIPDSQADDELAPLLVGEKRKRAAESAEEVAAGRRRKNVDTAAEKSKKKPAHKTAKALVVLSEDEEDDAGGGSSARADDVDSNAVNTAPPLQANSNEETGKGATSANKSKKAPSTDATVDRTKKKVPSKRAKGMAVLSDDEEDDTGGATVPHSLADSSIKPRTPSQTYSNEGHELTPVQGKSVKKKQAAKKKAVSDSEEDGDFQDKLDQNSPPRPSSKQEESTTFNSTAIPKQKDVSETPKPLYASLSSRYTIASRTKSTPMAELIRRVSSRPGSPFPPVAPRARPPSLGGASGSGTPTASYSPYNKFSRSALSKIAPLHPNRRTPPPPLPPPPPKPKTKKEKEREERWEEEMIEDIGGWEEWKSLSEQEQKAAKRAKWARELEGYDD